MTPAQIELARHALGLPNRQNLSYRNHFVAREGHPNYVNWCEMVEAGEARSKLGSQLTGGDPVFWLTLAGASLALRKGEHIDMGYFIPLWEDEMPRKATRAKRTPLPAGQVAAMMAEAERRYNDHPNSAYGSAHAVLTLCREIQRQAKVIDELERKLVAPESAGTTRVYG